MAKSADFSKILASLNTKLARQKEAILATEQHIAAIEALRKMEAQGTK